jgi:TRAP-type transport system periplasmic protein
VHKHHRYITLSGHLFGAAALICNKAAYGSWPANVRKAVDEAAAEATQYQHRLAAEEDAEILARIDPRENEVISLTDTERAAFIEAVQPVLAKYRSELPAEIFELARGGKAN